MILQLLPVTDVLYSIDLTYILSLKLFQSLNIHWIKAFLSDRVQQVCINGANSTWKSVTSGIPQGSVLGRILFVLYINDLQSNILSDVYVIADDTKIVNIIKSPEVQDIFQNDLDSLSAWSDKWLLKFHPEKCKVMHLGKTENTEFFYKLEEGDKHHELAYTEEEKDIGVFINGKLDFEKHINIKINKACVWLS